MQLSGLKASGTAIHRVDRLCRDLNGLSMIAQSSEGFSKKSRRREALPHLVCQKRRRYSPCTPQATAVAAKFEDEKADVQELKAQLLDSLYGVERGLQASAEVRAEIGELIGKLEANNPTPAPNQDVPLLSGTWTLIYTCNSELAPLLALGKLPGITVGDIQQIIFSNSQVENKVNLNGPFLKTSFSTTASIDISSPKRLEISFLEGRIATPQLLRDVEFPDSIYVLGQYVDLTNLKNALHPVNAAVKDAADQISDFARQSPDFKFQINGAKATSWLLTTFLDSDMRISRGDGGSIFVLVKS